MFGVNPWMGHQSMEETMRYVHVAEHHPRLDLSSRKNETDSTRRGLAMLNARASFDLVPTVCQQRVKRGRKAKNFKLLDSGSSGSRTLGRRFFTT